MGDSLSHLDDLLVQGLPKQLPGFLPPQAVGPEAKTRGGTLGFPTYIHTRVKKIC